MGIGASLLTIFILCAVGFSVYKIHQNNKWLLFAKIIGTVFCVVVLIAACSYAYIKYQNRAREVNTLGEVSLGMTPLEVTLAIGKPGNEKTTPTGTLYYVYGSGNFEYFIVFDKDAITVNRVCHKGYKTVFGVGVGASEDVLIDKFGRPSDVSIHQDGLEKLITFEQYNIAFEIEKKRVEMVCVTTGKMYYNEEYQK